MLERISPGKKFLLRMNLGLERISPEEISYGNGFCAGTHFARNGFRATRLWTLPVNARQAVEAHAERRLYLPDGLMDGRVEERRVDFGWRWLHLFPMEDLTSGCRGLRLRPNGTMEEWWHDRIGSSIGKRYYLRWSKRKVRIGVSEVSELRASWNQTGKHTDRHI